jgi:hypothetical protein
MHEVPFLYEACIIFYHVKAALIFVVTCCTGHFWIQECWKCVKLSYVCD